MARAFAFKGKIVSTDHDEFSYVLLLSNELVIIKFKRTRLYLKRI